MIEACRAAVRPRVVSPETGDVVLLEDEVAVWLEGDARTLRIVGGPGSGKTTAIRHLGAVFGTRTDIIFIDDGGAAPENILLDSRRLIYSAPAGVPDCEDPTWQLASWNQDDLLEYCLARHKQHCASIIERIRMLPDARRLHGIPQLWTMVIDAFAADEAAGDWRSVLRNELAASVPEVDAAVVRHWCLCELLNRKDKATRALGLLSKRGWVPARLPWIRHRAAQSTLAAAHVVYLLNDNRAPFFLEDVWPDDLIEETATLLLDAPEASHRLNYVIAHKTPRYHSAAATLLHAMGQGWQPPPRTRANLAGAIFAGAVWPGIDLSKAKLSRADLSDADLSQARLDHAQAQEIKLSRASLKQASLRGANLRGAMLIDADLTEITSMNSAWQNADFRGAKLHGANLHRADLQHADFTDADLTNGAFLSAQLSGAKLDRTNCSGADFRNAKFKRVCLSTAILTDARFDRADLEEANLENLHWPAAMLRKAYLRRAYLTGSSMPGANLQGATLCEAGLADIDWEGADLRDADFSNCAFHLGSSRSGLVGSPIACEGSRTGFYTDDFLEQDFKSPEEIRKANLCGADLRGAIVDRADFYLVDLRGTRYTPAQAEHFRRCGAILFDRVQRR
ncbi:MAG TPA: pentapeptide repeat-containing protein [Pirellulales bacterium]|nr:pentapeptide repeat-containing protein [Pirellulales bacterium]